MAAQDVSTLYAIKYTSLIRLLAQQLDSRFAGAATQGDYMGAKQGVAVDQIGVVAARKRTTRYPEISPEDVPHYRRWVYPSHFSLPIWLDKIDQLEMLGDPKGPYGEAAMAAMRRQKDDLFVTALTGTAKTDETGSTSTAFDTTNQKVAVDFGASASTNMTVKKLRKGLQILASNEVDLDNDPVYVSLKAIEHDSLLSEAQVISGDFYMPARPVLTDGRIGRYLGIDFIHSERTIVDPLIDSTYVSAPMWAKSGMHWGIWQEVQSRIDQRTDREGMPWQVYVTGSWGATRLEEKKVVVILSDDTK